MPKEIKFKNLHLSQSSIKHDYIKVRSTIDQSKTDGGNLNVNYDTVDCNIGNSFRLYDNKIQIVSDKIHHVKVTSVTWIERGTNSYVWCHNTRNGNSIGAYMIPAPYTEVWQSVCLTSITEVQKNDYIYFRIYFSGANKDNMTRGGAYNNSVYMMVEAID